MSYWLDYINYCNSTTSPELPNILLLGLSLIKELIKGLRK